ncbi:hypothetical protein CCP4SC76_5180007 [Gammaproteobacteria bacterium]
MPMVVECPPVLAHAPWIINTITTRLRIGLGVLLILALGWSALAAPFPIPDIMRGQSNAISRAVERNTAPVLRPKLRVTRRGTRKKKFRHTCQRRLICEIKRSWKPYLAYPTLIS